MPESPKRLLWVDMAKSFALILVVVGHPVTASVYAVYIYWFHMPVFFILSGYLFKPLKAWEEFGGWAVKRCRELLIPYFCYVGLVTLARYYFVYRYLHVLELSYVWNDLKQVLFGGRQLGGYYTVFWFFTCLLATQLLFAVISLLCRNNSRLIIAAVALAYLLAHLESWWIISHPVLVPWDLDVALVAVAYYAIGHFGRRYLSAISLPVTLAAAAVSALLIAAAHAGLFVYVLNLKYVIYNNILLDLLIPMVMCTALFGISQLWAGSKLGPAAGWIGSAALPIVFLHVPINTALLVEYHLQYGNAVAALIGFLTPLLLSKLLLDRFAITQQLFQGQMPRRSAQASPASTSFFWLARAWQRRISYFFANSKKDKDTA